MSPEFDPRCGSHPQFFERDAQHEALVDQTRFAGRRSADGFTLTETIIVVFLLGMVAAIAAGSILHSVEKARLARCFAELRGIQAAMWYDSDDGQSFKAPGSSLDTNYPGIETGQYFLLVGDGTAASGNDDGEGSGMSDATAGRRDVKFVVVCRQKFPNLADYVYIEDEGPPRIVTGPHDDPGYGEQPGWEPANGFARTRSGGTTGLTYVAFAGSRTNGALIGTGTSTSAGTRQLPEGRASVDASARSSATSGSGGRSTGSRISGG
jgi:prepilin-type N-terminal cleavage/methylation domain-containing protein